MSYFCVNCKNATPTEVRCKIHGGGIMCYVDCPCKEYEHKPTEEEIRADERTKVIDEFADELEYQFKLNDGIGIDTIDRIAERLKSIK